MKKGRGLKKGRGAEKGPERILSSCSAGKGDAVSIGFDQQQIVRDISRVPRAPHPGAHGTRWRTPQACKPRVRGRLHKQPQPRILRPLSIFDFRLAIFDFSDRRLLRRGPIEASGTVKRGAWFVER